ncbi:DUF262 domain-containing protein [Herbaspirillum rhizosphaerae]|uniref:DUF262 domain-containing protein n=1 Tax=Herbaspirillum rhizosphaerae TaxID=346179 RepID=UPI00067CC59A|nr:DUF262 domain-containing protein [Herbaspirillum rhizosphaerae]
MTTPEKTDLLDDAPPHGVTAEQQALLDKEISEIAEQHDLQLREYPIEVLVHKYADGLETDEAEIFIPGYQREFIWLPKQQSRFIESLFLNLPIPPLFLGDTDEESHRGALEVIDGTQRLRTLHYFMNDQLILCGLKKIQALNGFRYSSLPRHWQRRFKSKSIRIAVLAVKLDEESRREMFDRLNSGGTKLQPMEQRRGHSDGPFLEFIERLAKDAAFRSICPLPEKKISLREYEEMLLRFFAYLDRHEQFVHEVDPFLTDYLKYMNDEVAADPSALDKHQSEFSDMVAFVQKYFPAGFRKDLKHNTVPRVRFEAIAVGTALALRENPDLVPTDTSAWLEDAAFKKHTRSDATNSKPKLLERLWFVRDKLLGRDPQIIERRNIDEEWKSLELF